MSDTPDSTQPQLTAGDELELELRSRLVSLEAATRALAGGILGLAITCAFLCYLLARKARQ